MGIGGGGGPCKARLDRVIADIARHRGIGKAKPIFTTRETPESINPGVESCKSIFFGVERSGVGVEVGFADLDRSTPGCAPLRLRSGLRPVASGKGDDGLRRDDFTSRGLAHSNALQF